MSVHEIYGVQSATKVKKEEVITAALLILK